METVPESRAVVPKTETAVTPLQVVDALHEAFGNYPGARAMHAKGIILKGFFKPAHKARQLTTAPHLQGEAVPVTVRFSDFTGVPTMPNTEGSASPRGLALKFHLPGGAATDIITHSFNGFPVATTRELRELMLAIGASRHAAGKPTALDQFLVAHPAAKTFLTTQKPLPVSYATLTYYGVNSYQFTNAAGVSHFIRYQLIPEAGEAFLTSSQAALAGPDYLLQEIRQRVTRGTVAFTLCVQLAEAGDVVEDPSVAWPDDRKKRLLGRIEISNVTADTDEGEKELFFGPNNVTTGITAADPMLLDREEIYAVSVKERQSSHP